MAYSQKQKLTCTNFELEFLRVLNGYASGSDNNENHEFCYNLANFEQKGNWGPAEKARGQPKLIEN